MLRFRWIALVALLIGMGLATTASARSPKPPRAPRAEWGMHQGGHWMVSRLIDLGLTDKQILKLEDIRKEHLKQVLPLIRELNTLHQERDGLKSEKSANKDRLVAITKRLGELRGDLEGKQIELQDAAKKVLTAEQLEKLGDDDLFGICGQYRKSGPRPNRGEGFGRSSARGAGYPDSLDD